MLKTISAALLATALIAAPALAAKKATDVQSPTQTATTNPTQTDAKVAPTTGKVHAKTKLSSHHLHHKKVSMHKTHTSHAKVATAKVHTKTNFKTKKIAAKTSIKPFSTKHS